MAKAITWCEDLAQEYDRLYKSMAIDTSVMRAVERAVEKQLTNGGRERYEAVDRATGVPWDFVAALHMLEAGGRWDRHLHNGDPLTSRTVHVPAGRPLRGSPPFSWHESAIDAMEVMRLDEVREWSTARKLYEAERYNGFGYRLYHPDVRSPYLWGGTTHYRRGKYVADGKWSASARSKQTGVAVYLRVLGLAQPEGPRFRVGRRGDDIEALQRFLNRYQRGAQLAVDGICGRETARAFEEVFGVQMLGV